MSVREQILLMINEIKKYSNLCFHEEHFIEILNGNKEKNILGMMPHPERAVDALLGNTDGIPLFESLLMQKTS